MKKFLLTLGTTASIFAPIATVVACDEESEAPADPDDGAGDGAGDGGEDNTDSTNLNLLGFAMPVYTFPNTTDEVIEQLVGVTAWANELGLKAGTGDGIVTITYKGELTKFVHNVSVTTSVEGVFNISDYATSVTGDFTDLKGAIAHVEANLTIAPTPELQLTAVGTLMYEIFVDEKWV